MHACCGRGPCVYSNVTELLAVCKRCSRRGVLSVYAGATASAAMVLATLFDGAQSFSWRQQVDTTAADAADGLTANLRWDIAFSPQSAAATLLVNVSAPTSSLPPSPAPPPTPAPAPCARAMCGAVAKHAGDVSLSGDVLAVAARGGASLATNGVVEVGETCRHLYRHHLSSLSSLSPLPSLPPRSHPITLTGTSHHSHSPFAARRLPRVPRLSLQRYNSITLACSYC